MPNVEKRLSIFKNHAISLAVKAIQNSVDELNVDISSFGFTHIITVTCTGLYSPGIDAELIEFLKLPEDIFHTSVNFMGCNAAFHALKIADLIARCEMNAKVLVICVELCTLHFQPKNNHDNLLSNTIFGDGAAAVIITSDSYANQRQYKGFEINGFSSALYSKGKSLMGWNVTPVNFEMILDASVPEFLGGEINNIVHNALFKLKSKVEDINRWAVHPGGKKILDVIKKQLPLSQDDLQYSYKVLKEFGNMSSPTILFVLKEMSQVHLKADEKIFAIGFGPGLSIESAIITYVSGEFDIRKSLKDADSLILKTDLSVF